MAGYAQTSEELAEHLRDQLSFLRSPGEAFDAGHESEAKRLAVVLRVLLHDTPQSRGVLSQLGVKDKIRFVDTAEPINPRNLAPTSGLAIMKVVTGPGGGGTWEPRKVLPPVPGTGGPDQPFDPWWTRDVVKDGAGNVFSRKSLVLAVVNKDGGAHVDPTLNAQYAALSRENSMGFVYFSGADQRDFDNNIVFPSVRQIAWEVEQTLERDLVHLLDPGRGEVAENMLRGLGRNDTCPCGSGRKIKRCHGA